MKVKLLMVDDEMHIRELVRFYVEKEGFGMIDASNGKDALDLVENEYIDLAIVDIMMPVMDGFEFVRQMKQIKDIPAIMLTAKDTSQDKVHGFDIGIDDYIVKPFDGPELIARIKNILKRYSVNHKNIIKIGGTVFDGDKYEIVYDNKAIHLPLKQFELVFELAKKPNQIFTREQLIEKIWGFDYDGNDRTVDVHVKRVRENLSHIKDFDIITIRGLGYKLQINNEESL